MDKLKLKVAKFLVILELFLNSCKENNVQELNANKKNIDSYGIRLINEYGNFIYIQSSNDSDSIICICHFSKETKMKKFVLKSDNSELSMIKEVVISQLNLSELRESNLFISDGGISAEFKAMNGSMSMSTNYNGFSSLGAISPKFDSLISKLKNNHLNINKYFKENVDTLNTK